MTVTFPETTGVAAILTNDLEMTGKLPSPVPNVYTYAPFKEASSFGKAALALLVD
jgi:hypothetical protein